MIKLYQFAFSHFCEKARWALDYKSIPYTPINLLPGLHIKTIQKLAPKTCMPVLADGETAVQDLPAIITYLDKAHPDPLLTPRDPREAREALDWENISTRKSASLYGSGSTIMRCPIGTGR